MAATTSASPFARLLNGEGLARRILRSSLLAGTGLTEADWDALSVDLL